jgi:hypothetical protein
MKTSNPVVMSVNDLPGVPGESFRDLEYESRIIALTSSVHGPIDPFDYDETCLKYPGLRNVIDRGSWESIRNNDLPRNAILDWVRTKYCPMGIMKDMWEQLDEKAKEEV